MHLSGRKGQHGVDGGEVERLNGEAGAYEHVDQFACRRRLLARRDACCVDDSEVRRTNAALGCSTAKLQLMA